MPHEKYQTDLIATKAVAYKGRGTNPESAHEQWARKLTSAQLKKVIRILGIEFAQRKDFDPVTRRTLYTLTGKL